MRGYGLFLAVYFVRNGEFLATFSATSGEYATTVSGQHTLTETMLVVSLSVVRLECSFHCLLCCFIIYFLDSEAPTKRKGLWVFGLQS